MFAKMFAPDSFFYLGVGVGWFSSFCLESMGVPMLNNLKQSCAASNVVCVGGFG